MCYYCENGLPPRVAEIINPLIERFPRSRFGPAHIVIDDFNLDDESIRYCLAGCSEPSDHHDAEISATRLALLALLEIPEPERNPAAYLVD